MPSVSASRNALVSASVPAVTAASLPAPGHAPGHPSEGDACRVFAWSLNSPNRTKLASESMASRSRAPDLGDQPVALLLDGLDGGQQLVGVGERRERGGLGEHGQVVGQPHELQRVDDSGVRRRDRRGGRRRTRTPSTSCTSPRAARGRAATRSPRGGAENSAYASSTTTSPCCIPRSVGASVTPTATEHGPPAVGIRRVHQRLRRRRRAGVRGHAGGCPGAGPGRAGVAPR